MFEQEQAQFSNKSVKMTRNNKENKMKMSSSNGERRVDSDQRKLIHEEKIVIDLEDEEENEDDNDYNDDNNEETNCRSFKNDQRLLDGRNVERFMWSVGELVWFDPNLFGYSIPGKVIDCHQELGLLSVEAYTQPEIIKLSQIGRANKNEIDEYERNWLKPDRPEEKLQVYRLSDESQLISVRRRLPLAHSSGSSDLVDLNELSVESIVWNLNIRFKQQLVYTNCGHKILMSVNPNSKQLSYLYNLDQVNKYDQCNQSQLLRLSNSNPNSNNISEQQNLDCTNNSNISSHENDSTMRWLMLTERSPSEQQQQQQQNINVDISTEQAPPHIFGLANSALRQLLVTGQDQCFLLLGDSGSGKTEASKLLLQYLAAVNRASTNLITEQLLESIQLLESFGNAKTIENLNSSRHSKLFTLKFSLDSGHLINAQTNDLSLLDRTRIVSQNGGERNYHVFYELLSGLNREEREKYGLEQAEKYFYLNQGNSIELDQKDDSDDFRSLLSSMQVLGFDNEERDAIFRLLASILHLGNIYFHRRLLAVRSGKLAKQTTNNQDSHLKESQSDVEGVEIGSDTEVRWISHLLQIQLDSVLKCLTVRTSECLQNPNSSSIPISSDKIVTPLNIDQALDTRDAIAKALYTCLFRWLIQRINATISVSNESHEMLSSNESSEPSISGHLNIEESSMNYQNEREPIYLCQTSDSLCEFQPDKLNIPIKSKDGSKRHKRLRPFASSKQLAATITILDAFGFENLSENNFEQLCINYTTEYLRYHSQRYLVRLEQVEYEKERLSLVPELDQFCGSYQTQIPSLNLVNLIGKKPLGILPILDDECNFPKGTDISFIEKCHHNHALNDSYIRSQSTNSVGEFGIRHFSGPSRSSSLGSRVVWYQVEGFIEKNRDSLRPNLIELLMSSKVSVISNMISKFLIKQPTTTPMAHQQLARNSKQTSEIEIGQQPTRTLTRTHDGRYLSMKPRQATISARFQDALNHNRLLDAINPSSISKDNSFTSSNVWFLVCLKPNRSQSSKVFDVAYVQEQISCLDILPTTAMRKFGYPVRLRYSDFVRRYQCLMSSPKSSKQNRQNKRKNSDKIERDSKRTVRGICESIIMDTTKTDDINPIILKGDTRYSFQCGLTKMFLSEKLFHHLERKRLDRYRSAIQIMQKSLRMWLVRRNFLIQRQAAVVIQATWRTLRARRAFLYKINVIIKLQRRWREILLKRRHNRLEAKRKAQRKLQLSCINEMSQAQQVNQMRFRQQLAQSASSSCLDIPSELAHFYRSQRNWEPEHDINENLIESQMAELLRQEADRLRLIKDQPELSVVPFVALSEGREKPVKSIESDMYEILLNLMDQYEDLDRSDLNQLEKFIFDTADEDYSLKRFVEKYYSLEVPQFGYSRIPITRPFSWPQLRLFRGDLIRLARSEIEIEDYRARFSAIKSNSLVFYKLILRYIDSNHKYKPDNDGYDQEDNQGETRELLKFKLIADYMMSICIKEIFLRDEIYLQLISLSWQNGKQTSALNTWKFILNCLTCFGTSDIELNKFILRYTNDYCPFPRYRSMILELLAQHLVKLLPSKSVGISHSRKYPITLLEYLANERSINLLMLPTSAYMDDHLHPNGFERPKRQEEIDQVSIRGINYSMRTLVQLRPFETADIVATRALKVRGVSDNNLLGWSLEVQHTEGSLSEISCRLKGDEYPLDHLSRFELMPQMVEMIENPIEFEQNLAKNYSRSSKAGSFQSGYSKRSLETNYNNSGDPYCPSDYGSSVVCASSDRSKRKRRNSSSGVWSSSANDSIYQRQYSPYGLTSDQSTTSPSIANSFYKQPDDMNGYQAFLQNYDQSNQRQYRRSMSMQELQPGHALNNPYPAHMYPNNFVDMQVPPKQRQPINDRFQQHYGRCCVPNQSYYNNNNNNYAYKQDPLPNRQYPQRRSHRLSSSSSLQQLNQQQPYAMRYQHQHPQVDMQQMRPSSQISYHSMDRPSRGAKFRDNLNQYDESQHNQRRIKNKREMKENSGFVYEHAQMSGAMSDTSEAPSLASHVRRVKAPVKGSDADLDRYLDDLFNPMLNEADLDELSDARSLATSIKGTKSSQITESESKLEAQGEPEPERLLSPTFEHLLMGLMESRNADGDLDTADQLKSMNLNELKALNEKLESKIEAARSSSSRMSIMFGGNEPTLPNTSDLVPEPPPQPNFSAASPSSELCDDIYSRAKTIKIGKWRWPPALAETEVDKRESEEKNDYREETDDVISSDQVDNVGRVKLSSEMKAKLEQLTTTNSNNNNNNKEKKIDRADQEKCSVSKIADQRRNMLEKQLIGGTTIDDNENQSDRPISSEIGAIDRSGKVLAAKQQLAAAAGVALSALDSNSGSSCGSSRRQSTLIQSNVARNQQQVSVESSFVKGSQQVASHESDELGPKSQTAINQRQAFYESSHLKCVEQGPDEIPPPVVVNKRPDESQLRVENSAKQQVALMNNGPIGKGYLKKLGTGMPIESQSNSWVSDKPTLVEVQKSNARSKMKSAMNVSMKSDKARRVQERSFGDSIEDRESCLTYGNVSWRVKLRKEFFMPGESYEDPLVLQLIFNQLVADVFNPRQWTRLNCKERSALKALMKDNSIGYAARLPQLGEMDDVKRDLVKMARSFGLYFTRTYPAENFAFALMNMSKNESQGDDSYEEDSSTDAERIANQLNRSKQLGSVWLDLVAIHHSGLRLVSSIEPTNNNKQDANLLKENNNNTASSQLSGYKVIDTLKYRDMNEIVLLGKHEILIDMSRSNSDSNGIRSSDQRKSRSWILSSDQATKLATLLKCFLADYRRSHSMRAFDLGPIGVGQRANEVEELGIEQASYEEDRAKKYQSKEKNKNRGRGKNKKSSETIQELDTQVESLASLITSRKKIIEAQEVLYREHERNNNYEGQIRERLEPENQRLKKQQLQQEEQLQNSTTKAQRIRSEENALLASDDDHNVDHHKQRQVSDSFSKLHSMSSPDDALVYISRISPNNLASSSQTVAGHNGETNSNGTTATEPIFDKPSGSSLGIINNNNNYNYKLDRKSKVKSKKKLEGRSTTEPISSSIWHNSISKMSNRFSLFGSHSSRSSRNINAENDSNSKQLEKVKADQLVQESMQIGLDSWIETKAEPDENNDDESKAAKLRQEQESKGHGETESILHKNSHEMDEDVQNCETQGQSLSSEQSSNPQSGGAQQQEASDGRYSFLQFALYNFREAIEKYSLDSRSSVGNDTSTLRGSLKLIESLRSRSRHGSSSGGFKSASNERADWTWRELAQMVKYTRLPLKRSLLKLPSEDLNRRAIDCFAAILQYMGDLPEGSGPGSKSASVRRLEGGEIECVYLILMNCHNYPPLRDEVYCQLIKQTTNNRSTNNESCLRCWRLFSIVAAYFDCSDLMRPYLVKYLETAAFDKRRAFCSIALICLQNLRKTFKYSGRKNVPSIEEIAATSAGRNSKRQIYRLPGGTERVINTKSTTVVADIIYEICANMLNITEPYEMLEFSLYCIADGNDPYTMPLNRDDYILDVTTELIKNHQQYFLIFCRSVWFYPLRLDSKLYIEVIFNQIAPDYLEGLLLILPDKSQVSKRNSSGSESRSSRSSDRPYQAIGTFTLRKKLVKEIARIGSLLHRASGNDSKPKQEDIKYLLPKPIVSAIKNRQSTSYNKSDNTNCKDTNGDGSSLDEDYADFNSISSSQNWIEMIQNNWAEMSLFDVLEAKAQFLDVLHYWPLFGSSFFACKLIQRDLIQPIEFILALNKLGIQLLDTETHQFVHKYTYNEIISTRKVRSEDGALFLDLKCGNLMKRTIIRIQTDQAHEISRLIRQYIDIEFLQAQSTAVACLDDDEKAVEIH